MHLLGGFGCLELVLYGIRGLAEQHYDSTNGSKTSIFLDQCERRTIMALTLLPCKAVPVHQAVYFTLGFRENVFSRIVPFFHQFFFNFGVQAHLG